MNCLNCGKQLTKKQIKYCSNQCQQDFQYNNFIEKWKNGEDNGLKGEYGISNYIRLYFYKKYNSKCQNCGWGEINPYTKKIPLEIHHIDGDYKNNKEDNLQLLCPNCHSLTSNYKSANPHGRAGRHKYFLRPKKKYFCKKCGVEIPTKGAKFCVNCLAVESRIVDRPSREILKQEIRTIPFVKLAEKYGVSDKAIAKWCIAEKLPSKKKDINAFSDEEWEKV